MADVETNILLRASGSDEAAAEISKASRAMENLGNSSENLKGRFQERFQHMGLNLFAGDALRASGLGRETRAVIQTLNIALTEGAEIANLSSGGFLLIVTALTALVGIISKVSEHHKELEAQLEKVNEANHKQLTTTQESIKAIEGYITATGQVPEYLKRWEQSERDLEAAQVERQIKGDRAQLMALTEMLNKEAEQHDRLREMMGDEETLIGIKKKAAADVSIEIAQLEKMKESYDKQSLSLKENKAKVDQLIASLRMLSSHGTDDLKSLTKAAEDSAKKQEEVWKHYYNELLKEDDAHLAATKEKLNKQAEHVKHVADQIGNDLGGAFAKSLVEGKNFTDQMHAAFKNMAEQIIQDIIRMITEWAIFTAMTGMGGGVGGIGMAGLHKMGFATGGDVMVDRPTLFLAGDNGPEHASFTPLSEMGRSGGSGGGGGGGTNIGAIHVTTEVHGVTDPDQVARTVGRKIIEQIRGAGQLAFTRG